MEDTITAPRPSVAGTCHGCERVVYSARYGQHHDRRPHVRCAALRRNIPMILNDKKDWLGCEVPPDCPELARARNFFRG